MGSSMNLVIVATLALLLCSCSVSAKEPDDEVMGNGLTEEDFENGRKVKAGPNDNDDYQPEVLVGTCTTAILDWYLHVPLIK